MHAHWEAFRQTDFCKLVLEDESDGGQSLRVVSLDALPAELVLVLGDAVHNMRCALDYTVSELLGWKDLTFPMDEGREELEASFRTEPEIIGGRTVKKGRNAAIEVAVPGIGRFITDERRPYKTVDGYRWPLGNSMLVTNTDFSSPSSFPKPSRGSTLSIRTTTA
jgi:hypothetical protein